jgi:hypothetical protein
VKERKLVKCSGAYPETVLCGRVQRTHLQCFRDKMCKIQIKCAKQ